MKGKKYTTSIMSLVVLCIIIAVGYYGYKKYILPRKHQMTYLIETIKDAKYNVRINKQSLPNSYEGNEFNLNFWIYINDYRYRSHEDKILFARKQDKAEDEGSDNDEPSPLIMLEKNMNHLNIRLNSNNTSNTESPLTTQIPLMESFAPSFNVRKNEYRVENIDLQKWVNINIGVRHYNLDIYIDGKLIKSVLTDGYPVINTGDLDICPGGGFNGFISKVEYSNKLLSTEDVYKRYLMRPE